MNEDRVVELLITIYMTWSFGQVRNLYSFVLGQALEN